MRIPELEHPPAQADLGREEVEVEKRAVRVAGRVEREREPGVLECRAEAPSALKVAVCVTLGCNNIKMGKRESIHDHPMQGQEERSILRLIEVEPVHARSEVERSYKGTLVREQSALDKVCRRAVLYSRLRLSLLSENTNCGRTFTIAISLSELQQCVGVVDEALQ
jgi:hypothetical protein